MTEVEIKRDERKSIVCTTDIKRKYDEIVKRSGKEQGEYFEELVNQIYIGQLTIDDDGKIPTDIKKHFTSDVAKLKNATQSIINTFISQMENLAVEKDEWGRKLDELKNNKDNVISEHANIIATKKEKIKEIAEQNFQLIIEKNDIAKNYQIILDRISDQEKLMESKSDRIKELLVIITTKDKIINELEPYQVQAKGLLNQIERERFEYEKAITKKENDLMRQFAGREENIRKEVRESTELNLHEFYLEATKHWENTAIITTDHDPEESETKNK